MATSNVTRIKSVPRLVAAATLCANVVLVISAASRARGKGEGGKEAKEQNERMVHLLLTGVEVFANHSFPTVRVRLAEQLYAVLSSSVEFSDDEEEGRGGEVGSLGANGDAFTGYKMGRLEWGR